MSAKFEKIKSYYYEGYWSKAKVRNAVVKGLITAEEYELITHEKY